MKKINLGSYDLWTCKEFLIDTDYIFSEEDTIFYFSLFSGTLTWSLDFDKQYDGLIDMMDHHFLKLKEEAARLKLSRICGLTCM